MFSQISTAFLFVSLILYLISRYSKFLCCTVASLSCAVRYFSLISLRAVTMAEQSRKLAPACDLMMCVFKYTGTGSLFPHVVCNFSPRIQVLTQNHQVTANNLMLLKLLCETGKTTHVSCQNGLTSLTCNHIISSVTKYKNIEIKAKTLNPLN